MSAVDHQPTFDDWFSSVRTVDKADIGGLSLRRNHGKHPALTKISAFQCIRDHPTFLPGVVTV